MPTTRSAVELFISARAAAVTVCNASDVLAKEPESAHWLSNFGLAAIYNDFPPEPMRPFAINFIRRIYLAFIEYDLGRKALLSLVKNGNGRWTPYFVALTHFELTISQLYVALDSIRKLSGHNFFKAGDGSFEECLNRIYNAAKHELAGNEVPVWLTNDGMECKDAKLTFEEIEHFMSTMAGVVKGMYNQEIASKAMAK